LQASQKVPVQDSQVHLQLEENTFHSQNSAKRAQEPTGLIDTVPIANEVRKTLSETNQTQLSQDHLANL